MTHRRVLCGLTIVALASSGCIARIHHKLEPLETKSAECVDSTASSPREQIVGLALSGGGSRAAVFGAASLEALWEHGLLDLVTHISSVSGGSIAASYFIANRPDCDQLESDGEWESCWRDFFSEYKKAMRSNLMLAIEGRQILKARWFSNSKRASSLQESMDHRFLHGLTFGELAARNSEARNSEHPLPTLLINASSYDEARRFVFSNQCLSDDPGTEPTHLLSRPELRARTFSRPECARPVPPEMPISLAVATSAAFPGIGPVSIEVPSTCDGGEPEYWHLGDGGIFDNSGVDTLEEVILREQLDGAGKLKRALILSVHSGMSAKPEELKRIRNFWLYLQHSGLIFDIASQRGQAYHDLLWERLKGDIARDGVAFAMVEMRYTDARFDQWPESCGQRPGRKRGVLGAATILSDIADRVSRIPTRFRIADCDADLLDLAAHSIVHAQLSPERLRHLKDMGFPVRLTPVVDHVPVR